MPIFLDSHQGSELSLNSIRDFLRRASSATTGDRYGVRPLDLYCGAHGSVFCVVVAPDEAAVRQQHAEQGVVCRRVRHIWSIGTDASQLSDDDLTLVRRMIAADERTPAGAGNLREQDERLRQVG
jgi:hypothetical protein